MKLPPIYIRFECGKHSFTLGPRRLRLILFIVLLAVLVAKCDGCESDEMKRESTEMPVEQVDSIILHSRRVDSLMNLPRRIVEFQHPDGTPIKNRVLGVGNYDKAFPDMNDVQLRTASRLGIAAIADRAEAHRRRKELVYIGENPHIHLHHLSFSIPYLVPRAERLLTEVAHSFADSLRRKGLPMYKPVVTSVLRTKHDVKKLRRVNVNASENSCHQHGTTFDICYNHFVRVIDPADSSAKQVWDGPLKEVLAEVLRDLRDLGLCYVRYERQQACFHITAR